MLRMAWQHSSSRIVPSAQELSQLPAARLSQEIVDVEAVLANRYNPNGTFAELCDGLATQGRQEQRAFWADIVRYRANLYTAQNIQALEYKTGGIGMLDADFGNNGQGGAGNGGWGSYGW